jgi:hypothetical protein
MSLHGRAIPEKIPFSKNKFFEGQSARIDLPEQVDPLNIAWVTSHNSFFGRPGGKYGLVEVGDALNHRFSNSPKTHFGPFKEVERSSDG